ncbi:MAG: TIGR02444 family protein [Rhodospirillaceae bacterium]|jgi:uncharacterized protein (TIGR02444 family)|nr:TIGR02444 family protein [Rhodospirillaceae bacterium]MBT6118586.1 TIGR02444 family protein [Rhodospirillaceae bacterium]
MSDFPASELWDFTISVYGREGVSAACIALQDRRGLDVDMILMCCWLGASGRGRANAQELDAGWQAIAAWQAEVVGALRAVRRRIKDGYAGAPETAATAVGKAVLKQEIEAEHVAQIMLEATIDRAGKPSAAPAEQAADAAANLALYLKNRDVSPAGEDRKDLATILAGTAPDLSAEDVRKTLDSALGS